MNEFHLIAWKEFEGRKLIDRAEVVKTEAVEDAIKNVKSMNAQKRLTTTDYRTHNLTELFKANKLSIAEEVKDA